MMAPVTTTAAAAKRGSSSLLPLLLLLATALVSSVVVVDAFVVAPPHRSQARAAAAAAALARRGASPPPPPPQPCTISRGLALTTTPQQQQQQRPTTRRWAGEGEGQEGWLERLGYKASEEDRTRSLKDRLKSAGLAGVFAYVASEVLFWFVSLPAGILFYHQTTGEWLDLSTPEGKAKVAGFSAGFLAFARVALPVRAAVALAITPPLSKFVIQPLIDRGVLKEREEAPAAEQEG